MNEESQPRTKIMVVDDDPDILLSLQTLFEMEGFEVITVDNGWKCIKELEKGFKGIIILDLIMPVMDGIETINNMIIDGFIEDNIIVVLTVHRIQGTEFDEIYPYVSDYIIKPFDVNHLLNTIKKISKNIIIKKKVH